MRAVAGPTYDSRMAPGPAHAPLVREALGACRLFSGLDDTRIDHLVAARASANRSQAIESAVAEKLDRMARTRLARECAKLNPREEKALSEEGLAGGAETWPEY